MMREIADRSSPQRHCHIALCSLSTGSSSPPPCFAVAVTSAPAMTSTSLLARTTALPARRAASVGISPAAPTVPTTTRSASVSAACSSSGVQRARAPADSSAERDSSRDDQIRRGLNSRACSSSSVALRPAARPMTSNRSRCSRTTSSVWRPIEPVEPRMTSRLVFMKSSWSAPPTARPRPGSSIQPAR